VLLHIPRIHIFLGKIDIAVASRGAPEGAEHASQRERSHYETRHYWLFRQPLRSLRFSTMASRPEVALSCWGPAINPVVAAGGWTMTSPTSSGPVRAQFLRSLLALAVLVPVGVLFGQLWQEQSDRLSFAAKERDGIEYLTTLGQVTTALTDAQSDAIAGGDIDETGLARAVDAASAVDARLGDDLRTRDRWSGLRAKIEALPTPASASKEDLYTAYGEATDLLLALYGKVRENSHLIRDPEGDTYFLQDGAAEELPESVVAAGRFADLVVLAADRPASERSQAVAELTAARQGVLDPASDLADGLQSAVDSTDSRTMGGNLLSRLDRFRRGMDVLANSAGSLSGRTALPRADQLAAARNEVQIAATELSTAILAELDQLIEDRISALETKRWLAVGTLGVIVLLAVTPMVITVAGGRKRRHRPFNGVPETVPSEWERAGAAR
jgi:hypothetical protein